MPPNNNQCTIELGRFGWSGAQGSWPCQKLIHGDTFIVHWESKSQAATAMRISHPRFRPPLMWSLSFESSGGGVALCVALELGMNWLINSPTEMPLHEIYWDPFPGYIPIRAITLSTCQRRFVQISNSQPGTLAVTVGSVRETDTEDWGVFPWPTLFQYF